MLAKNLPTLKLVCLPEFTSHKEYCCCLFGKLTKKHVSKKSFLLIIKLLNKE